MKNDNNKFSIIDKGMTVDGSLAGKGNLVVKGAVKGILHGESVVISEEGRVSAQTKARTITIGGQFEGTLEISGQLVLLSTGKCSGEVICDDLVVEAGGLLEAKVTCKGAVPGRKK